MQNLTTATKLIVDFISGYISRKLNKELKCEECIYSLVTSIHLWHHKLIQIKDTGGLCYSTEVVYKICLKTETLIRHLIKTKGYGKNFPRMISNINTMVLKTLKHSSTQIFSTYYIHTLYSSQGH